METSVCQNCNKPIFFGPSDPPPKKYLKYDDSWKTELWRHTHSKAGMCDATYAIPNREKNMPFNEVDETSSEVVDPC